MVAKSVRWAAAGLLVFPTAALALGLGDIHLKSTLDAPLDANIEILGATPGQMANLKPKLASRAVFKQHGLDWSPFLTHLTLRVVHLADGRNVIEVRSRRPVTAPFLTLLVELNWQRGELLREYDVLLNPPNYAAHQSSAAASVAPPVTGPGVRQGQIKRAPAPQRSASAPPVETTAKTPVEHTPAAAASASSATPHSYAVHRGDSLYSIAGRFAGTTLAARERWMLATFHANPAAFDHNMNWLRAGTVLRLPGAAAVAAVSATQARDAIHRQYVAWRGQVARAEGTAGHAEPGRLRLVAPSHGGSGASTSTAAAGAASGSPAKALQAQVQTLQAQLATSRRLLALKSAQLQKLQAQLAAREGEAPAATAATAAASAGAAHAPPPASGATKPPAAKPAATPRHRAVRRPPAATNPSSANAPTGSWLARLEHFWWVLALAVVALLGYLGLRGLLARRKSGFDESLDRLAQSSETDEPTQPHISETPLQAPHEPVPPPPLDDAIVVEESGTHERPRLDVEALPAEAPHVEADDTVGGDTSIKLDQGDPLAEADFHMAYGLYDQAADLIRIAIERDPQRRDLRLKLLEVFFVWGNKEQFLQSARELAATRVEAGPGEWDKIVIMGKQIAPEDPLFVGGAAVSGAAAAGVDLDLEGGQHQVDFDVAEDANAPASDAVDLDIGTALEERDGVAEAAAHQATDRNLALDDSLVLPEDATAERTAFSTPTRRMTGLAEESTSATREMTGTTREMEARASEMGGATREMTTTLEQDDWDPTELTPDAPTVERPALHSGEVPPMREKVEMALKAGGSEHTAELALDDLGLDLGELEQAPAPAAEAPESTPEASDSQSEPDAPTLVAGLDEHSRRVMETAERQAVARDDDDELKVSASGTWHFDEDPYGGERGAAAADDSAAREDLTDTSRLAALQGDSVDFEVGEATHVAPKPSDVPVDAEVGDESSGDAAVGLDFDVGASQGEALQAADGAHAATQRLASDEIALPDLDPVTMSEVGTKLDLARAYMDMGDPEGARNILEEVLGEGSGAQKQEAERLIASLPG